MGHPNIESCLTTLIQFLPQMPRFSLLPTNIRLPIYSYISISPFASNLDHLLLTRKSNHKFIYSDSPLYST